MWNVKHLICAVIILFVTVWLFYAYLLELNKLTYVKYSFDDIRLTTTSNLTISKENENKFEECSIAKCFNLFKCLLDPVPRLRIAIQPIYRFVNNVVFKCFF